jgi:transcription antitermination factor NusG
MWKIGAVAHRAKLCFSDPKKVIQRKVRHDVTITSNPADAGTSQGQPWWALYTRHQHEKTIATMLSAKGFEVFLPLYESTRRWKDRSKLLSLPLFPCYVFVRGELDRRLQIMTTPGIHMILCNGEHFATIPEDEIHTIRRTVEGPFRIEPHPFLKCGERVRVTRGALEGVEGILVRKKSSYRLVLSVDMVAQSVSIEIDANDVEPVIVRSVAASFPSGPPASVGTLAAAMQTSS